jgi:hypothetical protein
MSQASSPDQRRSRLMLAGLAALFFLPLALSFLLYYGTSWRPLGGTQHGELLDPPRPLPEVALPASDGEFLRGRWHLVQISSGDCDQACRDTLVLTRQVRLALDKDMTRVGRVLLHSADLADLQAIRSEHPDLDIVALDGPGTSALLATFPQPVEGQIFIVDPIGNLMMRHPGDTAARGLLKDLERLLKLSHIG